MRILMFGACPYPVPQGSQILLRESALALRTADHDVHLLTYGYGLGDDRSELPLHRAPNIPFARKTAAGPSLSKPFLDTALALTLRKIVRQHRIDAIGAHNYEALAVALATRAAPVVYHAHNAMSDELPLYFRNNPLAKRFGNWLDRTLPRRADQIIAPHDPLADYLASCGCDPARIAVIPPPLEIQAFDPVATRVDLPLVLYTGNLDAYQNLPLLLESMKLVRQSVPGATLVVATASPTPIDGAEIIHTPNQATLRALLRQDAVFVCPRVSWSGYPIKLLNAMAARQAIVCCKSSAHPLVHRLTALIVPDNDAAALAASILELMHDSQARARLGAEACAAIEANHAPAAIGERLSAVYAGLMRR